MDENKPTIVAVAGVGINIVGLDLSAPVESEIEVEESAEEEPEDDEEPAEGYTRYRPVETGLMLDERETSILFSDQDRRDGVIEVFTNSPVSINLFLSRGYEPYKVNNDSHFFRIPFRALSIRRASALNRKSTMTVEQRAAAGARLKAILSRKVPKE